jgi:hypothetical protein
MRSFYRQSAASRPPLCYLDTCLPAVCCLSATWLPVCGLFTASLLHLGLLSATSIPVCQLYTASPLLFPLFSLPPRYLSACCIPPRFCFCLLSGPSLPFFRLFTDSLPPLCHLAICLPAVCNLSASSLPLSYLPATCLLLHCPSLPPRYLAVLPCWLVCSLFLLLVCYTVSSAVLLAGFPDGFSVQHFCIILR